MRRNPGRARAMLAPCLFFALLAFVYVVTIAHGLSLDVSTANLVSWSIGVHGSPFADLSQVTSLADNPSRDIWVVDGAGGREVVGRAPGVIAVAVPAYWVAGLLGWGAMSTVPGGVTAALVTALAVTLLFVTLRSRMGSREALLAAGLFGLASPVWSVAADGMWPHTVTILGIVGMAWAADRERWWLVGLFGGVALWGRLHAAVICAVVGLLVAWWRREPRIMVQVGGVSVALLALMTAWTRWLYGSWNPASAYRVGDFADHARQSPFDLVNQLGLWVSPGRGMLVWTPLLLLLGGALVRGWRDLPDWSRALVAGGAVYTVAQLTLNVFKGGEGFFGYRIGLEMLACLAPALALTAHRMGPIARRCFAPVAVAQFAVFVYGAIADPRSAPRIDSRWTSNELVSRIGDQPVFTATVLAGGIAIGGVVARMWSDPDLVRLDEGRLGDE